MMRVKEIMLLTLTFMLIANAKAQSDSAYSFTLVEAQEYAINHFFVSKNAELDIEIAKKKIWETTAIGLPQVSGKVEYTHLPIIPEMESPIPNMEPIKMGVPNQVSYNVMVNQIIFSGEYIVGLQASKVYKAFASENYDKVKIDLRESIAGTYYSIKIIGENVKVLKETLENLKLNFNHTQKFFEQGLVEDTDVDQLSLVLKRTENSLRTIERQKEYLEKLFKYQVGLKTDSKIELSENIESLIEKNIIPDANYVFNLSENIDYKLLSTQESLQNLSMRREKSTFLPSVSAFYQYNDQFEQPDFDMNIKHIIGVNLAIPIFSSGMKLSKVSQAKMELYKAQNMKEQEAQRLTISAEQSQYDYKIALQNYYNEKENFELSERVFNKTTIRFKEGVVSALDLSMVNNQYLEAQLSLSTATQELLMAKIAIDKAFNKL